MTLPVPHLESGFTHDDGFDVEWWHVSTDPDRYEYRIPGTTMRVSEDDLPNYGACYSWHCGDPKHLTGWPAQVGAMRRLADAMEHWTAEHDPPPADLADRIAAELRTMPAADPHPHADGSRRLGRGLGALIPDSLPAIARPRLSFEWNDYGQHDDAAREAIDRVIASIRAEDARARSLLPDPPPGWEWDGELVTRESGEGVGAEVTARIVYRLREVTP